MMRNAAGEFWNGLCRCAMRPAYAGSGPVGAHQNVAARSRRGRRILARPALARPWRDDKVAARFHPGQLAGSARVPTWQCNGWINSRGVAACHAMTRIAELAEQEQDQ